MNSLSYRAFDCLNVLGSEGQQVYCQEFYHKPGVAYILGFLMMTSCYAVLTKT